MSAVFSLQTNGPDITASPKPISLRHQSARTRILTKRPAVWKEQGLGVTERPPVRSLIALGLKLSWQTTLAPLSPRPQN